MTMSLALLQSPDQLGAEPEAIDMDNYTTTDMGSGHFASDGKSKSAYIRNIAVTDLNGLQLDYGPKYTIVSDLKGYTLDPHYVSG